MAKLTADFLLERLAENGVKRIYGYPGDGINAIIGALERHKDKLKFVQVRHEEQAAFMACAHAKWTGEVGVCLATTSRCWRSSGNRRAWGSAAATSRRSTSSPSSRTSPTSTCRWLWSRRRCGT